MKKLLIALGVLASVGVQAGNVYERKFDSKGQANNPDTTRSERRDDPVAGVCAANDLADENTLYIPNSFTPNSDGLNDVFKIYGTGISGVRIEIYDRGGEKLFESRSEANGWDGCFKGLPCGMATYVYFLEIVTRSGEIKKKAGHVNLIR